MNKENKNWVLFIVIVAFIVSYFLASMYFEYFYTKNNTLSTKITEDFLDSPILYEEGITYTAMYGVDEQKNIVSLVIEQVNNEGCIINYVTILNYIKFPIDNKLKDELKINKNYATIVEIYSNLQGKNKDERFIEILSKILDKDVKYYIQVDKNNFNKYFYLDKNTYKYTPEEYNFFNSIRSVKIYREYLDEIYSRFNITNLDKSKREELTGNAFLNTSSGNVLFNTVTFEKNRIVNLEVLDYIFTKPLKNKIKKDKDINIKIVNTTNINGYAARLKSLLEKEGFLNIETTTSKEEYKETVIVSVDEHYFSLVNRYLKKSKEIVGKVEKDADIVIYLAKDSFR